MGRSLPAATLLAAALLPAVALAGPTTRVTWHGHAAFEIVTPSGKVLLIDPWLQNPLNPIKNPVETANKADWILVTHGHADHVGDAVAIGKKTGAKLVASNELGQTLVRYAGYPDKQAGYDTLGNPGGRIKLDDEVTVTFVPAVHSSGFEGTDPGGKSLGFLHGGHAVGYVVQIKDGPTIYHSGDTAYFSDMALIADFHPDLALLNIGGHFGMEPTEAARAARAVKAKLVVPHHYKTMPILTQDPKPFFKDLDKARIAHHDLAPGGTMVFEGRNWKKAGAK